ncbi:MAG: hypothetical protein ACPGRZ_02275 [Alphaproteobacteria bacterium]
MSSKTPIAALTAALMLVVLTAAGSVYAAKSGGSKGRLSANQFISMQPFNVPMMPKNNVKQQFTLMIALELHDEDERDYVKSRLTMIRSRTYDLLFRLIAYRTQEPLVPSTGLLKKKLLEIATNAVGRDKIASIVVQQVYHGRAP